MASSIATASAEETSSSASYAAAVPMGCSLREAVDSARRMRTDLRPHTRDRRWRFKSYGECFRASHAVSWAKRNISADEDVAVEGLNRLVELGMLSHVVDPSKRFRVGEENRRSSYFRVASPAVLDAVAKEGGSYISSSPPAGNGGISLATGRFGSSIRVAAGGGGASCDLDAVQRRLSGLDHVLQQTVRELSDARGRLEVVRQEVLVLVSQQIATVVVIFLLYGHMLLVLVPSAGAMSWATVSALAITMVFSTRCGWRCISLWSDVDSSRTAPLDVIVVEGEDATVVEEVGGTARSSIVSVISKSLRSVAGGGGRSSFRRLASGERRTILARDAYTLPDVVTWKHRPLLICANTAAVPNHVPDHGGDALPLGVPFKFSSELFEGTCLIRLKGSRSDDAAGDEEYFSGRKRIFQSVVQGRFKEEVLASDVLTGHEFSRPLKNLPHPFVLKTATNFIGKIAQGSNIVVHTDQPHMDAILMSTSQVVRGDEPGNEPAITCRDIHEDCAVLGGAFAKGNVSSSRRKRMFSNPSRCRGLTFDTETVWTFEFYQNLFDATSYSLDLGFAKIGCSRVLDGQPIQWLGKMRDGRYLWSFQIWHERLLPKEDVKKGEAG